MEKLVAVLSGGLDSTTALYEARAAGFEVVLAVSFDYGQRHRRELEAARAVAAEFGVEHRVLSLGDFGRGLSSALTDPDHAVPQGHYADPTMRQTVVPSRNLVMLAVASSLAVEVGAGWLGCGVHAGDHAVYPDCRPEFVAALELVLGVANYQPVRLFTPFLRVDKGAVAKRAVELGVPSGRTWTCYEGGDLPCGKCGACVERAEAFRDAGVPDPSLP